MKLPTKRATLAIATALAVAAVYATPSSVVTIIMGTDDLDGGAKKLGEISPGSLRPNDNEAEGTICNSSGVQMGDVSFNLKKGTATTVTLCNLDGTEIGSESFSGGTATYDFGSSPVADDGCVMYKLEGISAEGTDNISVYATPSKVDEIGAGPDIHIDVFPPFEIDGVTNLRRVAVPTLFNPGFIAIGTNDDASQRVNKVEGSVQVVGHSTASISDVELRDSTGTEISGATYTITGLDFEITGFTTIAAGAEFRVVVRLDSGSPGHLARADVEGTFIP